MMTPSVLFHQIRDTTQPASRQRSPDRWRQRCTGDVHPPVGAQAFSDAVGEIAFHDGQKVPNVVRACLVALEPPVPLPVRQAHLALPLRTIVAPAEPSLGSDGRCESSSGTPRVDRAWG